MVFAKYFTAKNDGTKFVKPTLNAEYLNRAFIKAVTYVQSQSFGYAIDVLSHGSSNDYQTFLKRDTKNASNRAEKLCIKKAFPQTY